MGAPDDPEGDALAAEIEADRRAARDRWKRLVLYLPPLASLVVAAVAIGASHPRTVLGARVVAGAKPPADTPLGLRVLLVSARPDREGLELAPDVEVRVSHGMLSKTDDAGVAELSVPAPLPPTITIEAHDGDVWRTAATFSIDVLGAPDPSDGVAQLQRTMGHVSGDLSVDVAPDRGAIVPPFPGEAWVRVRDKSGRPCADARVTMEAQTGVSDDAPPTTTDGSGLARLRILPTSPPIVLTVRAEKDGLGGEWDGVLGAELGIAQPTSTRVDPALGVVTLASPAPVGAVYVDLFREGVRLAGARVAIGPDGRGDFPLPSAAVTRGGLFDLAVSTSPQPPAKDDLAHAVTWPIVLAGDPFDAWGALVAPRIPERIAPMGGSSSYEPAFLATIARAPVVVPARDVVADGLAAALARETKRGRDVRHGATFAIVGGALVELALMMWLGVFRARRDVEQEIAALARDGELGVVAARARRSDVGTRVRFAALAIGAVGVVALIFAALAVMAWGLPG
jgi:hypothetical protein